MVVFFRIEKYWQETSKHRFDEFYLEGISDLIDRKGFQVRKI